MTYDEVTLWTKFMQGKGVMNNFEYLYRSHKFDKRDLDTYLNDVDAEDVILSAFDFTGAGNTIFGYKYWKEINEKWQAKLTEFRNTGILTADDLMVYCPHCQRTLPRSAFALKSNMQLHKHCKECEGGKWDKEKKEREKAEKEAEKQAKAMKQLEKEIAEKTAKLERMAAQDPTLESVGKTTENRRYETARQQIAEGQANLGKTTKVCGHCGKRKLRTEFYKSDASEDGLQEYCKTCQTELLAAAEEAQHREDEKRKLEIEIAERVTEVQRMKAGQKKEEVWYPEPEEQNGDGIPGPENMLEHLPDRFTEEDVSRMRKSQGLTADGAAHQISVWKARGFVTLIGNGIYSKTTKYMERKRIVEQTDIVAKPRPVKPDKLVAPKLGEYDATLHYKQNQKSLTLNAALSAQIRDGQFNKCYLNTDRQHRQFLIFNRVDGANITGSSNLTQTLLNVTSADIARSLAARFDLAIGDNYYLHITKNLSKKNDILTVEVLAARSREEYIKIAERRELTAKGKMPPSEAEEDLTDHKDDYQDQTTRKSVCSTAPTSEPKKEEMPVGDIPLLDFSDMPDVAGDPQQMLQQLIERWNVTERDMAVFLYNKGWELHEPVVVTRHKKFSLK